MVYYITAKDYGEMRKALRAENEVGGYFLIASRERLVPVINSNGDSDSIRVSKSHPFVFHTHPGKCVSKMKCSLGVPSSQDMKQILDAATHGNIAHFVIAHEGMYIVQARCGLVHQYKNDPSVGEYIKSKFRDFQDQFLHSNLNYAHWVNLWLVFANQNGFKVHFFPTGSNLAFVIDAKC